MASSVSGALTNITQYTDSMAKKKKADDDLGMNDFLTMLVAQLQHQDPMNPMESQDFTAQLTQFSQLEAQFKSNETLEKIAENLDAQKGKSAQDYLNQKVTATVDTIDVTEGKTTGGYYTIKENASIQIIIYDKKGNPVKTLNVGQKNAGSYPVSWDGKDKSGKSVEDGTYKYSVQALGPKGYIPVATTVSGKVENVLYQGDKEYLVVNGVIFSPDSVKMIEVDDFKDFDQGKTFEYLGKKVTVNQGLINIDKGSVNSTLPSFKLEGDDSVRINIMNSLGQIVHSYRKENIKKGEAVQIEWNGKDINGKNAEDGHYIYQVVSSKNTGVDKSLTGEVTGVHYEGSSHFLEIGGVRVSPESIVSVQK